MFEFLCVSRCNDKTCRKATESGDVAAAAVVVGDGAC